MYLYLTVAEGHYKPFDKVDLVETSRHHTIIKSNVNLSPMKSQCLHWREFLNNFLGWKWLKYIWKLHISHHKHISQRLINLIASYWDINAWSWTHYIEVLLLCHHIEFKIRLVCGFRLNPIQNYWNGKLTSYQGETATSICTRFS